MCRKECLSTGEVIRSVYTYRLYVGQSHADAVAIL